MKKIRVLALESESYYTKLIDFDNEKYIVVYDGLRYYKKDLSIFDLVISFNCLSDLANYMIHKARLSGVKTLLIADGVIDWNNMFKNPLFLKKRQKLFHPIIHDYFLCVGEQETDYFKNLGNNAYKYFPKRMKSSKKNNDCKKFNFLITTANTPFFNETERIILTETLKNLVQTLNKLDLTYGFRIYNPYLIKELDIKPSKNFIKDNFENTVAKFTCLITTPSSISVTGMTLGMPVGQILYRDSPLFVQTGWIIANFNLEETLISMIDEDEYRMKYQDWHTKSYTSKNNTLDDILMDKNTENVTQEYFESAMYRLLRSKFNFNFEFFARSVYLKIKKYL